MAYISLASRTTGTLVTASMWNEIPQSVTALREGAISVVSQAPNDFLYASAADQLGRLPATVQCSPRFNGTAWEMNTTATVRAWARVTNSGTPTLVDDYNVASLTDNGVGSITLTFSQAVPDATYFAVANPYGTSIRGHASTHTHLVGSLIVNTFNDADNPGSAAQADLDFCVLVIGT